MGKYFLKRIGTAMIVVLVVIGLNFVIVRLAPGDPATIMAGFDNPSEEFKAAISAKYNLDKPLYVQFFTYVGKLMQGDLGESYYSNASVVSLIGERFGASLLLSGTSAVLAFLLGTGLGLIAGQRVGGIADRAFSAGAYVCNSMPSFWLGMMLILVFASKLGWLPTQGMYNMRLSATGMAHVWDVAKHMILPVATLTLIQVPSYFRITKSSVSQVLMDDYITTFRITGMSEGKIFRKYVLKNAILPVVTVFGINLAYVVGRLHTGGDGVLLARHRRFDVHSHQQPRLQCADGRLSHHRRFCCRYYDPGGSCLCQARSPHPLRMRRRP